MPRVIVTAISRGAASLGNPHKLRIISPSCRLYAAHLTTRCTSCNGPVNKHTPRSFDKPWHVVLLPRNSSLHCDAAQCIYHIHVLFFLRATLSGTDICDLRKHVHHHLLILRDLCHDLRIQTGLQTFLSHVDGPGRIFSQTFWDSIQRCQLLRA